MNSFRAIVLACTAMLVTPAFGSPISPAGERMANVLDAMGVNSRWLPGYVVNWETGENAPHAMRLKHPLTLTHCTGFVDAVARRLHVPIIYPKDRTLNPSIHMAATWLRAGHAGWHRLDGPITAQRDANAGELVIGVYDTPDVVGHEAVVRPSTKSDADILANGPQLAQAGGINSANISTSEGFSFHAGVWKAGQIEWYAHQVLDSIR